MPDSFIGFNVDGAVEVAPPDPRRNRDLTPVALSPDYLAEWRAAAEVCAYAYEAQIAARARYDEADRIERVRGHDCHAYYYGGFAEGAELRELGRAFSAAADAEMRAYENLYRVTRRNPNLRACVEQFCGREIDVSTMRDAYGNAARVLHGRLYCTDCCGLCSDCGEAERYHAMRSVQGDCRTVCTDCADEYAECEGCENLVMPRNLSNGFCSYCVEDARGECDSAETLGDYHSTHGSFRTIASPWTKAHSNRFFGVEVEAEAGENDRQEIAERILYFANKCDWEGRPNTNGGPMLFCETDGSLDYGIEMISNPMGLDSHAALWRALADKKVLKGLRSHDTSTCGLHIHVSRAGLSSFTLAKAVCFVNDTKNRDVVLAVARRWSEDHDFCKIKNKKLAHAARDDGDRYQAVNLTNRKTVEFRLFRGSLNPDAILAALEFVNAVLEFAAVTSARGMTTQAFLAFLHTAAMRADTVTLRKYIEQQDAKLWEQAPKPAAPISDAVLADKKARRFHASNHIGKYAECKHCATKGGK